MCVGPGDKKFFCIHGEQTSRHVRGVGRTVNLAEHGEIAVGMAAVRFMQDTDVAVIDDRLRNDGFMNGTVERKAAQTFI